MNERLKVFDEKMTKTMTNLDGELATIRAGRANPNVLNRIMWIIMEHRPRSNRLPMYLFRSLA